MPITLPKSPALSQLKATLKEVAEDGVLDNWGGETRSIADDARKVMEGLKTKAQLDLLVDKIDAATKPLKFNGSGGISGYAFDRNQFLEFLRSDAEKRLGAVTSEGVIDHEFP